MYLLTILYITHAIIYVKKYLHRIYIQAYKLMYLLFDIT